MNAIEYSEYDDINRVGKISYIRSQIPEKPVILDAVSFAYDNINNVTQKTTLTETESYTYDNNYRLTGVNYGKTGESLSYAYNTNGLRTSVTENGVPKTYTYNITGNEELTSVGTITYGYDAKGNVSRAGTGYYYHDDFNMLTEVLDSVNNTHVAYNYDMENRLKKRNDIVLGKKSVFLYEGRDIFAEVGTTQAEGLSSVYIRGINGELLKEKRYIKDEFGQQVKVGYYYYPDRMGSVYMVCDEKGMFLEKNIEDAFGSVGNAHARSTGVSKMGLSSNMYDNATGLYYFAARWYDPKVGRFLEMDPVLSEPGMMNMYDYCGNNPGNVTDRYGESWRDVVDFGKKVLDKIKEIFSKGDDKTASEDADTAKQTTQENVELPKVPQDENVDENIDEASKMSVKEWISNVNTFCAWDFKNSKKPRGKYENFGNFNYGATGMSIGFNKYTLLSAGGIKNIEAGKWKLQYGIPFLIPPFGDMPNDVEMINRGADYYERNYVR